jgi:hypothetical protein
MLPRSKKSKPGSGPAVFQIGDEPLLEEDLADVAEDPAGPPATPPAMGTSDGAGDLSSSGPVALPDEPEPSDQSAADARLERTDKLEPSPSPAEERRKPSGSSRSTFSPPAGRKTARPATASPRRERPALSGRAKALLAAGAVVCGVIFAVAGSGGGGEDPSRPPASTHADARAAARERAQHRRELAAKRAAAARRAERREDRRQARLAEREAAEMAKAEPAPAPAVETVPAPEPVAPAPAPVPAPAPAPVASVPSDDIAGNEFGP